MKLEIAIGIALDIMERIQGAVRRGETTIEANDISARFSATNKQIQDARAPRPEDPEN